MRASKIITGLFGASAVEGGDGRGRGILRNRKLRRKLLIVDGKTGMGRLVWLCDQRMGGISTYAYCCHLAVDRLRLAVDMIIGSNLREHFWRRNG